MRAASDRSAAYRIIDECRSSCGTGGASQPVSFRVGTPGLASTTGRETTVKNCGVAVVRPQGRVGLLLRRANHSEHGNRPGPAALQVSGLEHRLAAPTADRSRTGRSRRSTSGWGKPGTWGRAAAVSRREGHCNAGRCAGEYRRSRSGPPVWAVVVGIGDADQASPLGGGRSRPQVR